MPIHLYRSNQTENLIKALAAAIRTTLPTDPFERVPIVVGSRGMERWIRHELATKMDIAAGFDFPFPRQALTGATRWIINPDRNPSEPFWQRNDATNPFSREAMGMRILALLRRRCRHPAFQMVGSYLNYTTLGETSDVGGRELLFAYDVADALDRLMHERTEDALSWAREPDRVDEEYRWLAIILSDLNIHADQESPAWLHEQLLGGPAPVLNRQIFLFGLSTLGPGDRNRLFAISRSLDCHLFVLTPTAQWFKDFRTKGEARAESRRLKTLAELEALDNEVKEANPLLANFGVPSRDLQAWFEDIHYEGDTVSSPDPLRPEKPTFLNQLQQWVFDADGIPDATACKPWKRDDSISFHSTYGPLRQCEVLRDVLLHAFAADRSLEPRHVLIMTPNIESYGPLLSAVFSRRGRDAKNNVIVPDIPVSIADLGLRFTNPVAEVLFSALELARDRLTMSNLTDFLSLAPVRQRWGLSEDDVSDCCVLLESAGFRWGFDSADRARADQVPLRQNTVQFALERLALGVLMPDEDPLFALDGIRGPSVPVDLSNRERVRRAGRLTGLVQSLQKHTEELRKPVSLEDWKSRIYRILNDFTATSAKASWQRMEIDKSISDWAATLTEDSKLVLTLDAVYRFLIGKFELSKSGDRPITGAVQVCAMEPMRSVPFRYVILLGMDDGDFPRIQRRPRWDPMENRKSGERDRREIDRHLLLEAILSAREKLVLMWSGRDVHKGEPLSASVPIEEIIDIVEMLTASDRKKIVVEHPLQPWSTLTFTDPLVSFDHEMAGAVNKLEAVRKGVLDSVKLGLASGSMQQPILDPSPPESILLDDLAGAIEKPYRLLLRDRLKLFLNSSGKEISNREPLELDSLDRWKLRDRVLRLALRNRDQGLSELEPKRVLKRLRGEGVLPPKAAGEKVVLQTLSDISLMIENLSDSIGRQIAPLELEYAPINGPLVRGRVSRVFQHVDGELVLRWVVPSNNTKTKLLVWVHLLTALVSGHKVKHAEVYYLAKKCEVMAFAPPSSALAKTILDDLVRIWQLGRQRLLPLFKVTSSKIGAVLANPERSDPTNPKTQKRLQLDIQNTWQSSSKSFGGGADMDDNWVKFFFYGYSPLDDINGRVESDGLIDLARRVWTPIHRAIEDGKTRSKNPEAP